MSINKMLAELPAESGKPRTGNHDLAATRIGPPWHLETRPEQCRRAEPSVAFSKNWFAGGAKLIGHLRLSLLVALFSGASAMPQTCTNNSSPCLTALTNAASFETGPVAPGELVALFGTNLGPQQGVSFRTNAQSPYPSQLADVQLTFGGIPAPLMWVQAAQINAVAPWSLTPGRTTLVCVSYENANGNCLSLPVAQAAPAVFTVDGTYAAALNQDGSINSLNNPAAMGSIVVVWATGLGPITPSQADGSLVAPPLPDNVLQAGVTGTYQLGIPFPITSNVVFDVTYAGPAPYMVAGVSQVNFQVGSFPSNGMIYVTLPSSKSPPFALYTQ